MVIQKTAIGLLVYENRFTLLFTNHFITLKILLEVIEG